MKGVAVDFVHKIWKAIVAAVGTGITTYLANAGGGMTQNEWIGVVSSALVVGVGVWLTPNRKPVVPPVLSDQAKEES